MTAFCPQWAVILDGVGGVPPPYKAEDLSWDLRGCLKHNLATRFHWANDKTLYDKECVQEIEGDVAAMWRDPPGAWMARLLHLSISQTTLFGSTTVGLVSLVGAKLTYCHVGDISISVWRWLDRLQTATRVFQTRDQHVTIRTRDGDAEAPKQISVYNAAQRSHENISHLVGQADYGTLAVRVNDLVLVHSDGVTDNITYNDMKKLISEFYSVVPLSVECLVSRVIAESRRESALKPDDISVFAGVVYDM